MMPSLRELQRRFSMAIVFGDGAAIAALGIVAGELDPAKRVAIYRNNVLGNYRKALALTYPVLLRLVGAPFFDTAADNFIRGHASTRGDVNRYGGDFARFLRSYAPARRLKYLPDVARLEWAIDQTNIAADAAPMDTLALSRVDSDAVSALRFVLHPAARLLASPYPVLRIWQTNQPDHHGDENVDLGEGSDNLLVRRSVDGVTVERISQGEYALLTALAANATLGSAAERAVRVEAVFDLGEALRRHVASHTIVAFRATVNAPQESRR